MRTLLLSLTLLTGCHARFQREVGNLSAVRLVPDLRVGPDVDLARASTLHAGAGGVLAETYNLSQYIRENRLASIIAEKIDADQMNAAFVYGVRESLGEGPPFAATDGATARIDLAIVHWGLDTTGFPNAAMFTYKVRAIGTLPNGKRFYRSTHRCVGDAGEARWISSWGFGSRDAQRLEALPPSAMQETFDKAAYACGYEFAERIRLHAGL